MEMKKTSNSLLSAYELAKLVLDVEELKSNAIKSLLSDDWRDYYSLRRKLNKSIEDIIKANDDEIQPVSLTF